MADLRDPNPPEEFDPDALDRPYAEEPPEVEEEDLPRRAASARFIVDSEVGSEALLRGAMDPANQSLADALRLSFRLLQAVIVVLIVLFLASGIKTVDDGYSGVRTLWGSIVEPLSPGPKFSIYPYPAAEFVTFKAENRVVDLGEYFTVRSRGRPRQQILDESDVRSISPGTDGALITRDSDIAHLELSAKYQIDQPLDFVHAIDDSPTSNAAAQAHDADAIVAMALKRAAVHVVGTMSLQEFTDPGSVPEIKENLRVKAQAMLDEFRSGVRLVDITGLQGLAPYAIQKAMNAVQEAQIGAEEAIVTARKDADQTRSNMAGGGYRDVLALIDGYQRALDAGEQQKADETLAAINAKLESIDVTGEVTHIITRARAAESQIESTLGNEYKRFASLLPAYRKHPKLVVRQQWLEATREVFSHSDTEVIYVPQWLASTNIALSGSSEIQNNRIDARTQETEAAANVRNRVGPQVLTGEAMPIGEAGRQLRFNPRTGRLEPIGGN